MMFYTHLVWGLDLVAFLGPTPWIDVPTARLLNPPYAWSYLYYVESPALLWTLHVLALAVFALLTVGWCTRVTSILACIVTLSYCHRLVGAQFGLDQVNAMLALYLMLGPAGAVYSVDHWLTSRKAGDAGTISPDVATNIAIRLMQLHLCVIYLFGGISKLRGPAWWDGSAVWMAFASYEYQSLDMTWMGRMPWAIALMSHLTVFWETFYCVLIWPRWSRPIMLAMAVAVHGGIALSLGMPTFGLAMIIANVAFLPPELVKGVVDWALGKASITTESQSHGEEKLVRS